MVNIDEKPKSVKVKVSETAQDPLASASFSTGAVNFYDNGGGATNVFTFDSTGVISVSVIPASLDSSGRMPGPERPAYRASGSNVPTATVTSKDNVQIFFLKN